MPFDEQLDPAMTPDLSALFNEESPEPQAPQQPQFTAPPSGSQITGGPALATQASVFPEEKLSSRDKLLKLLESRMNKPEDPLENYQKIINKLKEDKTPSQRTQDIHQQLYGTGLRGSFNEVLNAAGNVGNKDYEGTWKPILDQQNKEETERQANIRTILPLYSQEASANRMLTKGMIDSLRDVGKDDARQKAVETRMAVQREANEIRKKHYGNQDEIAQGLLDLRNRTQHPNDLDFAIDESGGRDENGDMVDSDRAMKTFLALQKSRAAARPGNDLALTPEALKGLVAVYGGTGEILGFGMGGAKQKVAVLNEAYKNPKTIENLIGNKLASASDAAAMKKAQTTASQVAQFEGAAKGNLDNFLKAAVGDKEKGVPGVIDTGSPILNHVFRGANRELFGDTVQAKFDAARVVAYTEASKILSGALGNSPVSDSGRKEVEALLKGSYTIPQLIEVAKLINMDFEQRAKANKKEVDELVKKVNSRVNPPKESTSGAPEVGAMFNGSKILKVTPIP